MGVSAPAPTFPNIVLSDLDSRAVAVDGTWSGQGALVLIGHSDCETTRLALRYVERLHHRRGSPRAVVAVLQDEPEEARALVEEMGLQLPVLLDRDPYPLSRHFNITTVPAVMLVDGNGTVEEWTEAFRRADMERLAQALRAPEPFFAPGDPAPALRPG